eukprot:GHVU01185073.1.p3 GENE.GHVU01185073.1~~GHVU01185073.1.p3  ORF type:complete len:102 (-),score=2.41 GHVU01185073.1:165-470(-)
MLKQARLLAIAAPTPSSRLLLRHRAISDSPPSSCSAILHLTSPPPGSGSYPLHISDPPCYTGWRHLPSGREVSPLGAASVCVSQSVGRMEKSSVYRWRSHL